MQTPKIKYVSDVITIPPLLQLLDQTVKQSTNNQIRQTYDSPILTKQELLNKTRLRSNGHRFRTPESKRLLNAAKRELKQFLTDTDNASFQTFLQDFSPTASTDYTLWKVAKKAKQTTNSSHPLRTTQGTSARTFKQNIAHKSRKSIKDAATHNE
jgi:hypothetical protein